MCSSVALHLARRCLKYVGKLCCHVRRDPRLDCWPVFRPRPNLQTHNGLNVGRLVGPTWPIACRVVKQQRLAVRVIVGQLQAPRRRGRLTQCIAKCGRELRQQLFPDDPIAGFRQRFQTELPPLARGRIERIIFTPKSSPARSNDRSTSSENRSMTPNTFDKEVPPLNSNPAGGSGKVKTRLSVQQTQKSFSMIAEVSPRCRPADSNRSAWSVSGSRAISSMISHFHFILSNLPDDGRNPIGGITRILKKFLTLVR